MGTLVKFDDYVKKRTTASDQPTADKIKEVAIISPTALFSLIDFCLAPQVSKFSKENFNLLVEKKLLYRDSSVPFEVRTLVQHLVGND